VKEFHLKTKIRDITGKKVKQLRSQGLIPAVLYGHGIKPENLSVAKNDFKKIFTEAGTSSLITLEIEGRAPIKVLVHEPQVDPVSDEPIHIDFYKVRMDEKIKTEIPIEFVGESEAVKQLDGSLVTNRDNIEIECLPNDLIPNVEVDISALKTFEDQICVKDIKVPEKIEVLTDKDEVIAFVEPPRSEEELAELETPTAAEEEKEAIEQMEAKTEEQEGEKDEKEPTQENTPQTSAE
jgi:large subunit ribosomal protein L25